jgi:hypothetical protein
MLVGKILFKIGVRFSSQRGHPEEIAEKLIGL